MLEDNRTPVGSGEIICVEFYNWWNICSIASVMATWNIRSKKDGLGFPDHAFPLARNSMEGQWERVLLAG